MLVDLLKHAAEITKLDPASRREQLVIYINRAAQELYDSYDLPGSLWEREFALTSVQNRLITVPWYVGLIKGVRRFAWSRKIQLVDSRPRYSYRPWRQPLYQWRVLGDSPLFTHMTHESRVKIRLREAESVPVQVVVKGQTTSADVTREIFNFPVGTTELIGTKQWRKQAPFGIISITKNVRTVSNVDVFQNVDTRPIALIPNCLKQARNRVVQIHDGFHNLVFGEDDHIEMLFKWQFVPLEFDEDQFLNTDLWDQAIVWKMREHWHSTREGEEGIAIAASAKCRDLVQQLAFTAESEVEKKLMQEDDPYAFAPLGGRGFGAGPSVCTPVTSEGTIITENDMKVLAVQGRDELRTITGYVDKELRYLEFLVTKIPNDGMGGEFVFVADSAVDDDGVDYIKPNDKLSTNPGRWIRQANLT